MPRVCTPMNRDHARDLYRSGLSIADVAKAMGVTYKVAYRATGEHRPHRRDLDIPAMIAAYHAGASTLAMSKTFGVSRNVIDRRLLDAGLTPRSGTESMLIRMSKTTRAERLLLTNAAHDAVRGKPQTHEQRCKMAASRATAPQSQKERLLGRRLEDLLGRPLKLQVPCGPYNIDMTLDPLPVAVEVLGGHWHTHGRHAARHRERCKHILDAGFHLVLLWWLEPGLAWEPQQIVTWAKVVCRDPAAPRKKLVLCRGRVTQAILKLDRD